MEWHYFLFVEWFGSVLCDNDVQVRVWANYFRADSDCCFMCVFLLYTAQTLPFFFYTHCSNWSLYSTKCSSIGTFAVNDNDDDDDDGVFIFCHCSILYICMDLFILAWIPKLHLTHTLFVRERFCASFNYKWMQLNSRHLFVKKKKQQLQDEEEEWKSKNA